MGFCLSFDCKNIGHRKVMYHDFPLLRVTTETLDVAEPLRLQNCEVLNRG